MTNKPHTTIFKLVFFLCFALAGGGDVSAEEGTDHAAHDHDSHASRCADDREACHPEMHDARTDKDEKHDGHDHDAHSDKDDHGHDSHAKHNEKHDGHGHDEHSESPEEFLEFSWKKAKHEGVELVAAGPAIIQERQSFYGETVINGNTLVHVVPRFPGTLTRVSKMLGDTIQAGENLATVQSNESLSNYQVKAEIDGVIIDQDATKGEFVSSEKVLFKLANFETTWANIAVPPRLLAALKVGTPATVISQSTDARLDTQITYIRPTLSEATRSGHARLELPNQNHQWPPGMFVTVEVSLAEHNVPLAVPESSILLIENKPSVFVQATAPDGDEGFEVRHLKTGRSDGRSVEIVDGLNAKEVVAAGNTFLLKAEMGKSSAEHSH